MSVGAISVNAIILCLTSLAQGGPHIIQKRDIKYQGDVRHKVKMGEANVNCDDGMSNLEVDWLDSPLNYTCYHSSSLLFPDESVETQLECEDLPKNYFPKHFCMNDKLSYKTPVPTHGDHRPIWPKFGEYKFVPAQRWLHNIEHGAVVMLYHPCTHPETVAALRRLVTGCIRKHIITPSTNLSEKRPLALVAWGCRMTMSHINSQEVINFIKSHGLKGPEGTYPKEGQYVHELIKLAEAPEGSDVNDSVICPAPAM